MNGEELFCFAENRFAERAVRLKGQEVFFFLGVKRLGEELANVEKAEKLFAATEDASNKAGKQIIHVLQR